MEQDQPTQKLADEARSAEPTEATEDNESVKETMEQDRSIHSDEGLEVKKELVAQVETVHKEGDNDEHVEPEKPAHGAEGAKEKLVDILDLFEDEVTDAEMEAKIAKLSGVIASDAGTNWSLLDPFQNKNAHCC